jgi:trans-aconitate 3-methyltransferase
MAAFAKGVYDAAAYNAFRPIYPKKLFDSIWAYHRLGRGKETTGWRSAVDLGCGTGKRWTSYPAIARNWHLASALNSLSFRTGQATIVIAKRFEQTIGVDPSSNMVIQATEQLKKQIIEMEGSNSDRSAPLEPFVRYEQSPAENLPFLEDESVDLVTAGEHN